MHCKDCGCEYGNIELHTTGSTYCTYEIVRAKKCAHLVFENFFAGSSMLSNWKSVIFNFQNNP